MAREGGESNGPVRLVPMKIMKIEYVMIN
jgi:hypothetical protein